MDYTNSIKAFNMKNTNYSFSYSPVFTGGTVNGIRVTAFCRDKEGRSTEKPVVFDLPPCGHIKWVVFTSSAQSNAFMAVLEKSFADLTEALTYALYNGELSFSKLSSGTVPTDMVHNCYNKLAFMAPHLVMINASFSPSETNTRRFRRMMPRLTPKGLVEVLGNEAPLSYWLDNLDTRMASDMLGSPIGSRRYKKLREALEAIRRKDLD